MPVFTAIAAGVAAVAGAVGFSAAVATTIGAVGAFAARTLLTIGISKLLAKRNTDTGAQGAGNAGARVQLPPATNNKLPVVYGTAFVAPTITDAMITTDQTTMYYVCALSEVTDSGAITFGDVFYDGQLVTFAGSSGDSANQVASLTNNAQPPQTDTKVAGNLNIYFFTDGSSSGINTNGKTAIQILSDASIPAYSRWDVNKLMTKTAFCIVKIKYNQDAGTTNLGQLSVEVRNSLNKPGSVIQDYLTNVRYGSAVPVANIDTASLSALNTYSDELITFIPVGGGTATQARYRINGPVNTGQNCLTNLQDLCDACDSWLQYSELTGKWKVVINQSYEDYTTIDDLYLVDSYNLIGGIDINPIDLNQTFNSLEVQYPDKNIRDQTNYKVFNLVDYVPSVMSPNEAANQLVAGFPQVNNYIQAAYLGERRLLQSREDLVITCALDYSGIQLEAGDVIRVKLEQYGWDVLNSGYGKLFRVSQVQEVKSDDGFLGARITAFEYNNTIYADNPLNDFIPEANSGLSNPRLLDTPGTPILSTNPLSAGTVASFNVVSTAPALGSTMYMDFNYGTSTNTATHKLYKTVQTSDGTPFVNSDAVSIDVADLPPATYYWSTTARTDTTGYRSNSSAAYVWSGPNVTKYNSSTGLGGLNYDQMNSDVYGISRKIFSINFSIPNYTANTVTIPISATANTANVPVIISSTSVANTNYYPPYQNTASDTSSSGNGYYAFSSTGSYGPALSWSLRANPGEDNWYALLKKEFADGVIESYENMALNVGMTIVSDGPAKIQIVAGYTDVGLGYWVSDTTKLATYYLPEANMPLQIDFNQTFFGDGELKTGGIVMCRNINDGVSYGSNITLVSGTMLVLASKN
jgi:hypothetical protein